MDCVISFLLILVLLVISMFRLLLVIRWIFFSSVLCVVFWLIIFCGCLLVVLR